MSDVDVVPVSIELFTCKVRANILSTHFSQVFNFDFFLFPKIFDILWGFKNGRFGWNGLKKRFC